MSQTTQLVIWLCNRMKAILRDPRLEDWEKREMCSAIVAMIAQATKDKAE